MDFLLSFLEGIITFISPCLLPMLPIYVTYFVGSNNTITNNKRTLFNAVNFVVGFMLFFVFLGAVAGRFGEFIKDNRNIFNIVGGSFLIIVGLNYIGIINSNLLNKTKKLKLNLRPSGPLSFFIFGIVFSIGWTPCVGAFLGSALLLAANTGETLKGIIMLFLFSLGLGIPFVISALLIEKIKNALSFIKKHYKLVNMISGLFLIVTGIFMIFGILNYLLSILSF